MPQVYRRHSEYNQRPSVEPRRRSSLAPQATNADDSIVLSDLVRTGEASRLRRRGAMRIDHAVIPPRSTPPVIPPIPEPRPSTLTWGRVPDGWRAPTPPWSTSDPSGLEDEYVNSAYEWREPAEESRGNASFGNTSNGVTVPTDDVTRNNTTAPEDEGPFVLYCGGEEEEQPGLIAASTGPFEPSPFPVLRSSPASQPTRAATQPTRKKNGCGAIVHMCAFPQPTRGVWVGKEEASEVVVGLDASYFERSVVVKMMRSSCGCVREGVGCAVCGNTLGTRYLPCQTMSSNILPKSSTSSASRPPKPLHPSGPRYWQGRSYSHPRAAPTPSDASTSSSGAASSRTSPKFYVYTFFADHVSPSRTCVFPPHPQQHQPARPVPTPSSYDDSRPTSPASASRGASAGAARTSGGLVPPPTIMSYGFRWTASPRALASTETLPGLPNESEGQQPRQELQQQGGAAEDVVTQEQLERVVARASPRTPLFELPDLLPVAPVFVQQGSVAPRDRDAAEDADADAEDEVEGLGAGVEYGVRLDADGVLRDEVEEPNSPDKAAEQTVWPGR